MTAIIFAATEHLQDIGNKFSLVYQMNVSGYFKSSIFRDMRISKNLLIYLQFYYINYIKLYVIGCLMPTNRKLLF